MTKGNFTRDEWNHLLCLFNISHFSSTKCLEAMSKKTQEDACEERVTTKSKPMMNLVSRYNVRDPHVFVSTASESLEKTKSERQNVSLSSLLEQQLRTGRLLMNIDDKWSSLEWKSGEWGQERGDPSMTRLSSMMIATESNFSLRSRSFLNRVNDRLRKMLYHSSKDAMQDIDKRSVIW